MRAGFESVGSRSKLRKRRASGHPRISQASLATVYMQQGDKAAAALILQGALDAERATGRPAGELVGTPAGAGG